MALFPMNIGSGGGTAPFILSISVMKVYAPNSTANNGIYYTIVDFKTGQIYHQGGIVNGYKCSLTVTIGDAIITMGQSGGTGVATSVEFPYDVDAYYGISTDQGSDYCYIGDISPSNYTSYTKLSIPASTQTSIPLQTGSGRGRASYVVFKKP